MIMEASLVAFGKYNNIKHKNYHTVGVPFMGTLDVYNKINYNIMRIKGKHEGLQTKGRHMGLPLREVLK